jgi:hypothetical protein
MEWVLVKIQTKELLEVRLVELLKREYALYMVMPTKKDILANGLNIGHVKNIDLLTNGHNLISMSCHCQRRLLVILAKPRCLTLWIYNIDFYGGTWSSFVRFVGIIGPCSLKLHLGKCRFF